MYVAAAIAVPHPPLIIPAVGQGEEEAIRATVEAYDAAVDFLAGHKPETIVLLSPHAPLYADGFYLAAGQSAWGNFGRFGAPQVEIETCCDPALAQAVAAQAAARGIPSLCDERPAMLDHGALVPLYFINKKYLKYKLLLVGLSGLDARAHYELGQCIAAAAAQCGRGVALVASGDLSHKLRPEGPYGFVPEGPELDKRITRALAAADFGALLKMDAGLAEKGAECGLRSFQIMAGTLDGRAVQAELLSYQGPFGVGYAVASFLPGAEDPARRLCPK